MILAWLCLFKYDLRNKLFCTKCTVRMETILILYAQPMHF